MAEHTQDKRPHLVPANTATPQAFTAPSSGGGGAAQPPQPNRAQHGAALKAQLQALKPAAEEVIEAQRGQELEGGLGLQIQFVGIQDVALAVDAR